MKQLNILHISDVHTQKESIDEISEIVKKLIKDVKRVQSEKNLSIDIVCFTGDLIQRGDKALSDEKQWELAEKVIITPLQSELGLSDDRFIFVPGNHEVDISRIVPALENGLKVKSLQEINDIMDNFDDSYKSRLSYFYDIVNRRLPDAKPRKLGYSCKMKINGLTIGIACVDSAWRSSGIGETERGSLYVGSKQIRDLYSDINGSDIKICMMHHPVNWLAGCEYMEIDKELSAFDIVLCGHVHESNLKQIVRKKLKTLYNTAGKLFPLDYSEGRIVDGYNGYSILNVDYANKKCSIFFRTYFGRNRGEFDSGIDVCPNGEECYDLFTDNGTRKSEFATINGIGRYFFNASEEYALIKDVDAKFPTDFKQILVEPVLSGKSEYTKENGSADEGKIDIQSIVDSTDNIRIIGKKETGKTTLLQQIGIRCIEQYETKGLIPIYINMKYLQKGEDRLLNTTVKFIQDNILENESISRDEINDLISSGKMVFLIDNVDPYDKKHSRWLERFVAAYGGNKLIMTVEEEFFRSLDIRHLPDYGVSFKDIYIQYMGKAQIRAIVSKWAKGREDSINVDETVNKINSYCNQINFAKTPFNIAILMVIWDNNRGYVPSNEGLIMENYLEVVLEKLSQDESLLSTYSFRIKQDFLSNVDYSMYQKGEYRLTKNEFDKILRDYHSIKGFNIFQSKFDRLFFEKNILSYSGGYVVFSHTSFLEYFLAVYAYFNSSFVEEITRKGVRTHFMNVIRFYSGLNQDCIDLLDRISDDIIATILEHMDLIDGLNNLQIITEFKIDKDKFIENLKKNRPTQEELDTVQDKLTTYEEKDPADIDRHETTENSIDEFFSLLLIYGSIIKNAELLDNRYKIQHLEYYMSGMSMMHGLIIEEFVRFKQDMKFDQLSEDTKNR